METETEMRIIMVDMFCSNCNTGFMERSNNIMLTSNPPQYEHICRLCGYKEVYTKVYPYMKYVKAVSC